MSSSDVICTLLPLVAVVAWIVRSNAAKGKGLLMLGLFLLGAASTVAAAMIESSVEEQLTMALAEGTPAYIVVDNVLCVALVEEGAKLFAVLVAMRRKPESLQEAVLCFTMAHIGFSALEDVLYVTGQHAAWWVRAISALSGHPLYGVIMGFYYGKATVEGRSDQTKSVLFTALSLIVPVVIHGAFNVFASTGDLMALLFIILGNIATVKILMVYAKKGESAKEAKPQLARQATQPISAPKYDRIYCPRCRTTMPRHAHFCPACGRQIMLRPSFA